MRSNFPEKDYSSDPLMVGKTAETDENSHFPGVSDNLADDLDRKSKVWFAAEVTDSD